MARTRILVVEDLSPLAITYAAHLEKAGYEVVIAETGEDALQAMARDGPFGAILLDLQLPDIDGLDLLRQNPHLLEGQRVVVATGDASLARAIEAMRLGAFEFLVKPLAGKRLVSVIDSAVAERQTPVAVSPAPTPRPGARAIARHPAHGTRGSGFIGTSPVMREIYRQIECVAPSRATVFLTGESGTGKEVCAEAIHRTSGRGKGPFIAVNCGAIPENLLESELFGHMKGAFTGAVSDRIGAVQAADHGTLFLDEIGEMAPALQVKLLRFLQTGTVQRVGSTRVEPVDVRIICATNRDPLREVVAGRFREDLYYRLAVVLLHMPPLRDRDGDVPALAEAFLQRFAAEEGKQFLPLGPAHLAALNAYPWPGNVRELQNVIRRAAVLFEGPELPLRALPAVPPPHAIAPPIALAQIPRAEPFAAQIAPLFAPAPMMPAATDLAQAMAGLTLDQIERIAVEGAIAAAQGSLPAAARSLGVSPSTLYRKRERWDDERRIA